MMNIVSGYLVSRLPWCAIFQILQNVTWLLNSVFLMLVVRTSEVCLLYVILILCTFLLSSSVNVVSVFFKSATGVGSFKKAIRGTKRNSRSSSFHQNLFLSISYFFLMILLCSGRS